MRRSARALLLHCLRLDVVEATGAGSATLLSGILFSSLIGFVVAGIAAGESAPSGCAFCFALLGLFAFIDALGDVASAWLDPRDLCLLRALPVAPAAYARARLAALLLPVGAKGLALILPTACVALAHGELARAIAWSASFLAFAGCVAGVAVLLLLALRRMGAGARVRDALAWLRSLLLVAATAGWFALPADAATGLASGTGAPWLPSAWFAQLALALQGESVRPWLVSAAIAALLAVAIALRSTARSYLPLLESLSAVPARLRPARRAPWSGAFERGFVAAGERPTFRLALRLLRRERCYRLQALPLLAYPLLFLALGRGADDEGLFAILFTQLPALVLALAGVLLRFSDSPAGGFVLRWFGAPRGRSLEGGARKACWVAVAAPMALLVTFLLARDRGIAFGLAAGAVGLFASTLALVAARGPRPVVPFVERSSGRFEGGEGGAIFGLFGLLFVLALCTWQVLRRGAVPSALLAAASLFATGFVLRRRWPEAPEAPTAAPQVRALALRTASGEELPFARRLRRELRGLAAYFVAAAAVLTAFYAWL